MSSHYHNYYYRSDYPGEVFSLWDLDMLIGFIEMVYELNNGEYTGDHTHLKEIEYVYL